MAQEAYFDSNSELAMPHVVPNDENGCFLESSSSNSPREEAYTSSVDLPLSIVKMAELNANLATGDVYSTLLDKFTNPRSGVGTSSLVTNPNLILPSRALLQSSENGRIDPYHNLPSSAKSLLTDNLSNSAMGGSRVPLRTFIANQNSQQGAKLEQLPKESPKNQFSNTIGMKPDSNTLMQMLKKPRIDVSLDFAQERLIQQLLQRQDNKQLQDHNPKLRALIQGNHPLPQLRGLQAPKMDQHFKNQLQQQATHPSSSGVDGICSQRLKQYLYNLKNRPQDNGIDFWRNIVSDFYGPCAKERWCFSSYQDIGEHALGVLSLGSVGAWCCDLCGSRSGKGFETSFEVLPRLWQIKYESGVLEEILYLDSPLEHRLPSGVTLLEYEKSVQQSVYEQFRVIHEGKLRVTFGDDLKILSWEFCATRHDEFFPCRLIAPQVNQLMSVAQQYQGLHSEGTPEDKVPVEKLQESHDMFEKAGNQLTKSLDLPTVDELGFSKRYVRCLQIAEVLNIMKDLVSFSHDQKLGPIESLNAYPRQGNARETHGSIKNDGEQETSRQGSIQSVLTNENRSTGRNVGIDSHFNDTGTTGDRVVCNSRPGEMELLMSNYYQKVLRESLFNPTATSTKPNQSYLVDTASQGAMPSSFLGQQSSKPGLFYGSLLSGLPISHSSEVSKNVQQQQMIDKLLQNALRRRNEQGFRETNENIFSGLPTRAVGTNILSNGAILGDSRTTVLGQANLFDNGHGNAESSRGVSISDSLKVAATNFGIKSDKDMAEFHLPEGLRGIFEHFSNNDF